MAHMEGFFFISHKQDLTKNGRLSISKYIVLSVDHKMYIQLQVCHIPFKTMNNSHKLIETTILSHRRGCDIFHISCMSNATSSISL